jgi:hypothetical protein
MSKYDLCDILYKYSCLQVGIIDGMKIGYIAVTLIIYKLFLSP